MRMDCRYESRLRIHLTNLERKGMSIHGIGELLTYRYGIISNFGTQLITKYVQPPLGTFAATDAEPFFIAKSTG